MQRTEKTLEINAPVETVFGLYSDFERFPEWMKSVKEVRRIDEHHTKWTADAPLMNIEWEAETTAFEPNRRVAWQTVRGDVELEGDVRFEEIESGKTRMHVSFGFEPPAGRLGSFVAHLIGSDPEKQIDEELQRFAKLAESRAAEHKAENGPGDARRAA